MGALGQLCRQSAGLLMVLDLLHYEVGRYVARGALKEKC
jgi:hypothetical protein